jgi:hypothetical protein
MNDIYVVAWADYNHPEFWTDKKEEVDEFIINWINKNCHNEDDKQMMLEFYEDEGYLEDVWNVYCVSKYDSTSPR